MIIKFCIGKSDMERLESMKEAGDTHFKALNYLDAINEYTKCLDALADKSCDLALKCYGNRAQCHLELSQFRCALNDCDAVLAHRPTDDKALERRARAALVGSPNPSTSDSVGLYLGTLYFCVGI